MMEYDAEYIVNHINEFFTTKDHRVYPYKKEDIYASIVNEDYDSVKPWCLAFDIPFIEEEWEHCGRTIYGKENERFGRYLSKMKLKGFAGMGYDDSDEINALQKLKKENGFYACNSR